MTKLIRYWLPAALCVAGIVAAIAGGLDRDAFEVGTPLFAAGLTILAINLLVRLTIHEQGDRVRDEEQRRYYAAHGHWPGERRRDPR